MDLVDVLIAAEAPEDGATVAATLEALGSSPLVGRVVLVAPRDLLLPPPAPGQERITCETTSRGRAGEGVRVEPEAFDAESWHGQLAGRDALVMAGAAALLPGTLAALRAGLSPFRVASTSAWSAGGLLLEAPTATCDASGRPGVEALALAAALGGETRASPIGAAEPAATLFRGEALARLGPLPAGPATALVERLSFELARAGFVRAAVPAVVATRAGWRPGPSPDARVVAKHAALRAADARRRTFVDVARLAPRASRPRVALDLTGIPWGGARMNGTCRVALAAARALDAGLGDEVELELVVDDPRDVEGVAPSRARVVGLRDVPPARFDAALRPTAFHSAAAVLELARCSRSFSLVVLDLIAVLLEDVDARAADGPGGPTYDLGPTLDGRAVLDLALARARRVHAIGEAARDELTLYLRSSPSPGSHTAPGDMSGTSRGRAGEGVGVVPLADLRPPATPAPVPALVGRRFVLWVGNPHPHKRLEDALAAWDVVRPAGVTLALLGAPAPDRPDVVGLRDVDEGRLAWLYREAAAVLSTSLWEGFGLPVLEAAIDGAAIVAARTPQTEAVLGAAHRGLFVGRDDLAARLVEVLADPAPFRAPEAGARFPWAAFQAALVADVRAALAAPPTERARLPLDAAALLDAPRRFPARGPRAAAWLARQVEQRSPWLARLGRRAVDRLRRS